MGLAVGFLREAGGEEQFPGQKVGRGLRPGRIAVRMEVGRILEGQIHIRMGIASPSPGSFGGARRTQLLGLEIIRMRLLKLL